MITSKIEEVWNSEIILDKRLLIMAFIVFLSMGILLGFLLGLRQSTALLDQGRLEMERAHIALQDSYNLTQRAVDDLQACENQTKK